MSVYRFINRKKGEREAGKIRNNLKCSLQSVMTRFLLPLLFIWHNFDDVFLSESLVAALERRQPPQILFAPLLVLHFPFDFRLAAYVFASMVVCSDAALAATAPAPAHFKIDDSQSDDELHRNAY